jgi:hypothetical protein
MGHTPRRQGWRAICSMVVGRLGAHDCSARLALEVSVFPNTVKVSPESRGQLIQEGPAMSNAASRASTASGRFREVQNTAADPATMKLAQGLKELAEAVRELAREQENQLQIIRSRVS